MYYYYYDYYYYYFMKIQEVKPRLDKIGRHENSALKNDHGDNFTPAVLENHRRKKSGFC